jgi:hypothetical protein
MKIFHGKLVGVGSFSIWVQGYAETGEEERT